MLTPFDNLSGFERKVHAQQPSAAQQRSAGEPSTSGLRCMRPCWHRKFCLHAAALGRQDTVALPNCRQYYHAIWLCALTAVPYLLPHPSSLS